MDTSAREPIGRLRAGLYAVGIHLLVMAFLVVSFRLSTMNTTYVVRTNQQVIHAFMVGPLPPRLEPQSLPAPTPPTPTVAPPVNHKPVPVPVKTGPSAAQLAAQQARREAKAREQALAKAQAIARAQAAAHQQALAHAREVKARREALAAAHAEALAKAQAAARARAQAIAKLKAEEVAAQRAAQASLSRQVALAAARARAQAAEQAAARGIVARYKALIEAKVSQAWVRPPSAHGGLKCELSVRVIAGGQVISARIVRSSGNVVFDRSVVAAIYNAAPLPVPHSAAKLADLNPFSFVFTAPKGSMP